MPLVSIGMPVFNDKKFIHKAVNSLLLQTFTDFELIMSDDCSFDGSSEICVAYARQDERIKYIRQNENIGISRNMKFLLNTAAGKYFMWAANDDIWDKQFLETLLNGLESNPLAIVAFSPICFIDECDQIIREYPFRFTDYSGSSAYIRLHKLINIFDDGFGYGLFRREKIQEVEFPVWWWFNKKTAYNNIYPSLCFYLTKGNYVLCGNKPLWYNRLKEKENINHKEPYENSYIRGSFAFSLRKFNLFCFSCKEIIKAGGNAKLALTIFPEIFYKWFFRPSLGNFLRQYRPLREGKLKFW
ncbi:MAG TPA: glycosyltransferase family 2 protein [Puia sp.]